MLDRYLETSIQNKLQAFYYLRSQPEVSIKEMKNLLNTTSANIVSFLHELNSALGGLAEITVQDSHASLFVYENVSFLELQCLIPDKHFYLHGTNSQLLLAIKDSLADILKDWRQAHHIQYEMDPGHVLYLSTQLGAVLCQLVKPIPLLVVSDIISEVETIRLLLSRVFSPMRITLVPFFLNAQPLSLLRQQKKSIILVFKKFDHLISEIGLSGDNVIIPVSSEMTSVDIGKIRKAVLEYELNESFRLLSLSENTENEVP